MLIKQDWESTWKLGMGQEMILLQEVMKSILPRDFGKMVITLPAWQVTARRGQVPGGY